MTAIAERKAAIASSGAAASVAWDALMYRLVLKVARNRPSFTSDDVFDRLDGLDFQPFTHDRRAFGAVMVRAAKDGVCRRTNRTIPSRRKSLHASPRAIWISLINRSN